MPSDPQNPLANGASQKNDSGPDAVALAQKLLKMCGLEVKVVLVGVRMKPQLLEGGGLLFFLTQELKYCSIHAEDL